MLYQLENGDWIEPADICGLTVHDQSKNYPDLTPHVQINMRGGGFPCVFFNTIEGARQYRDDLARLAIAAQTEKAASVQG